MDECAPAARLRSFRRALVEVEATLAAAPADRLDAQIERGLRTLVQCLEVDRGGVSRLSSDGRAVHTTHTYARAGNREAAFPVIAVDREFPWLVQQVRQGRVIRLDRLPDDLPLRALSERRFATRSRFASSVAVPLLVPGGGRGALGFASRRPRAWPDALIEQLRFAAEVIGRALGRRQAQDALLECREFERLLCDLVKALVSASPEQLDDQIRAGLQRVVSYFGADRSGLARCAGDGTVVVTHAVSRVGVPELLSRIDSAWYVDELREGRTIRIDRAADVPRHAASVRKFLRDSGMRSLLTIPLGQGGRVWGRISLSAFHLSRRWTDEEARRLRLVGEIMREALQRREAGDGARRQQEDFTYLARVGALGQLAAALAHDLNQPLAAIKSNAQAVRRFLAGGRQPDDLDEVCSDIAADATRAADLIRRLRELLRRREGQRQPLNVNEVIEELRMLLDMEARHHGAQLAVRCAPDVPDVLGNRAQIQQVLLSLVRNAAEAMDETDVADRAVVVRTGAPTPAEAVIYVEDRGRGLTEGDLERLFTPFHSTKPGGTGLSLVINRTIVEAHGGRLSAERRPGGGLAVCLTLPARRGSRP